MKNKTYQTLTYDNRMSTGTITFKVRLITVDGKQYYAGVLDSAYGRKIYAQYKAEMAWYKADTGRRDDTIWRKRREAQRRPINPQAKRLLETNYEYMLNREGFFDGCRNFTQYDAINEISDLAQTQERYGRR